MALGDHGLAYQAFKVAVSVNPAHAEALNNLAVLELRRCGNISEPLKQRQALEQANSFLESATENGPHLFEPAYNRALTAFQKLGDFQECHEYVKKASAVYAQHVESKELSADLKRLLTGSE